MARGDKAAVEDELEEFVQGRYLALRRTAYLLCGDWHRAEDLVQGALVKVVVAARRGHVISDCRAEAEPDGSVVLSYSTRGDASGTAAVTQGLRSNEAIRVFPNGSVLSVAATNYYVPWGAKQNKTSSATPSHSIPLISIDELTAMVMDARWGLTVPAQFAQQAERDLVPFMDNTQH